ncbi:ATP-binding cassette domain-containing protein [Dermacoccaceae bacterium W4C1]
MTTPVLAVEDLVVEYQTATGPFIAVQGVSFEVEKGKTLAIVGESGCGKSTTAKALVRLVEPTGGSIRLDGTDITHLSEKALRPFRSRIQMVFQDPYGSLDPHLDARDIVAEPLRLKGIGKAERAKEAARLIEMVGLPTSALDRRPVEFSGGQRQRIGIARALASSPEVLVCDEVTSALDVSVQAQVVQLLRDLQAETQVAYVFISHNLGVVREISDDVVVMRTGEVVEQGDTQQVLAAPTHRYARSLRAAVLDPATVVGRKPRSILAQAEGVSA